MRPSAKPARGEIFREDFLTRVEAPGVAHMRPDIGLDVRQELVKVVPVMMDLLGQVPHAQAADSRVMAAAGEVDGA